MNTSLATRQFVRQVYGHFIGKGYYDSDEKFLKEAEKHGISRRTPANIAKNMRFGDRVVFLRFGGRQTKTVEAFAEMTIDNIVLEASIAKEVALHLFGRRWISGARLWKFYDSWHISCQCNYFGMC